MKEYSWEWLIGWNLFCRAPNAMRALVGKPKRQYGFPAWYRAIWRKFD